MNKHAQKLGRLAKGVPKRPPSEQERQRRSEQMKAINLSRAKVKEALEFCINPTDVPK